MSAARLTSVEAVQFFIAAMQAVSPDGLHAVEFHSGKQLWDWVLGSTPIAAELTAALTEAEKATVRQILDGMLRECVTGLTA